jgi:hypothetical protein
MVALKFLLGVAAAGGAIVALGAAQHPAALSQVSPGLWEIAGIPGAKSPLRECVADPIVLAQLEHRKRNCARKASSDSGSVTVINYTCSAGDFGSSKMTVITPRSMRIETQGISANLPFNYVLQARRVGDCPAR